MSNGERVSSEVLNDAAVFVAGKVKQADLSFERAVNIDDGRIVIETTAPQFDLEAEDGLTKSSVEDELAHIVGVLPFTIQWPSPNQIVLQPDNTASSFLFSAQFEAYGDEGERHR